MILASHVIFTAYGFWLPNDPRGSWSDFVRSFELLQFGRATKTETHRSVSGIRHDSTKRFEAKKAMKFPPVVFDGHQAVSIARGFERAVEKSGFVIHACAVMPDHAHLVVARHRFDIEQAGNLLKGEATKRLKSDGLHPMEQFADKGETPSPWAQKFWKVFLDSERDIERAIRYVERNPIKAGYKAQRWPCVMARIV